jgi:hypothetical protein
MHSLPPKWDPNSASPHNNLWLTPRRKARNQRVVTTGDPILCDPYTLTENIVDGFRIFTDVTNADCNLRTTNNNMPVDHLTTTVYTDSSCITMNQGHVQAGSGVWFGVNDPITELYAGLQVLKNIPPSSFLLIKTDSNIC